MKNNIKRCKFKTRLPRLCKLKVLSHRPSTSRHLFMSFLTYKNVDQADEMRILHYKFKMKFNIISNTNIFNHKNIVIRAFIYVTLWVCECMVLIDIKNDKYLLNKIGSKMYLKYCTNIDCFHRFIYYLMDRKPINSSVLFTAYMIFLPFCFIFMRRHEFNINKWENNGKTPSAVVKQENMSHR